ncbi:unnamed protein product [Bursaphelenchus okinawaensis]|uniref:Exonuclease domain-containing protein n=1 Tax=Bursaphelenchus okinawaensis TaxID=465554 RepID=A0A811LD02_9BILA|nr:unnamed protein product [Bursaphelenchus okinawaensis]CAG9120461.1 unnamed protein product [Bursaphelenchus okinawaensis]
MVTQCETLIFFDLETTGLITQLDRNDPRNPPFARPGDNRDVQKIFDAYDKVDKAGETKLPKIIELSMVAVPRIQFEKHITYLDQNHKSENKDFRLESVPSNVLTLQINPDFKQEEWNEYNQKEQWKYSNLKKEDLIGKLTFKQSWPIINAYLDALPGPVALIAHNGFNFDYRVLLAELRRNNLTSTVFNEKVLFLDTYLAFKDIEKAHHDLIKVVIQSVNWAEISNYIKSVPVPLAQDETMRSDDLEEQQEPMPIDKDGRNGKNSKRQNSIEDFLDEADIEPKETSVLKRPARADIFQTPTKQKVPENNGWKTAPSKLTLNRGFLEKSNIMNPLRFMKHSEWSPAKIHRIKDELFERKSDGSWSFHGHNAERYFFAPGQFKLGNIYRSIYNQSFAEHHAQDDCFALLHICLAYGKDFLVYADKKAVPLTQYYGNSL